jgi:hypothetical protein
MFPPSAEIVRATLSGGNRQSHAPSGGKHAQFAGAWDGRNIPEA